MILMIDNYDSFTYNLVQMMRAQGAEVKVVRNDEIDVAGIAALKPEAIVFSPGPGNPDSAGVTLAAVKAFAGKMPLLGICLGHQMICKAAGAQMEKLKFGHHGGNHPVANLLTGRVEITAQNHGFNLVFPSLGEFDEEASGTTLPSGLNDLRAWIECGSAPVVRNARYGGVRLTHVNLNDGTAEGIAFTDIPAFSVQYHPEANPGPTDSHYLFTAFTRLMDGREDYLDIDIAQDRLQGWRFAS